MQNELPSWADINATYEDVYLAALDGVDSDDSVTITITCRAFPKYKEVLKLPKRGSMTYHISRVLSQFVLIYSNEVVDDMVVRVTASQPIICYGMNHKQFTADAFLALPRNVAGMEYMVMSYPNSTLSSDDGRQSEFCVAAFDDSTVIQIVPSCDTRAGSAKGAVLTFILDSGQCVQVQASDFNLTNDLTGSRIHSLNKPIVVYGGHVRAEVPAGFRYPQSESTSRDHLCESLPSVDTWGTNFICNTFKNADVTSGDIVRVLASVNNTIVKINGVAWGNPLAAGAHRDTIIKKTIAIETSEPSLVGMFAHTTEVNNGLGDPFFAVISPLNQTYNDFTFFVCEDAVYNDNNFVIVVTEQSGVGKVELDGVKIPAISFQNIPTILGGKSYAISTLNVLAGPHRVYTPNVPANGVTVLAYGFGNVDSYGYTAGSLLVPKKGIIGDDFTFGGVPPGETPRSEIRFRSMLNEKVWLDSAVMTSISNPRYTVRTKKNIAYDISSMTAGQKLAVEVEAFPPPDEILFGEMTIHHHTTQWRGLRPATVPFVIFPKQAASVNDHEFAHRSVTVYPNPVIGDNGFVTLRVEAATSVKLRLYDATGREVLDMASRQISSYDETLNFPTLGLASGSYVLEVSMPELKRTERRHIIIQK
jgi:hypothetical protein